MWIIPLHLAAAGADDALITTTFDALRLLRWSTQKITSIWKKQNKIIQMRLLSRSFSKTAHFLSGRNVLLYDPDFALSQFSILRRLHRCADDAMFGATRQINSKIQMWTTNVALVDETRGLRRMYPSWASLQLLVLLFKQLISCVNCRCPCCLATKAARCLGSGTVNDITGRLP